MINKLISDIIEKYLEQHIVLRAEKAGTKVLLIKPQSLLVHSRVDTKVRCGPLLTIDQITYDKKDSVDFINCNSIILANTHCYGASFLFR